MKLYDYFRSSAAYRVRIALNLKGIAPDERTFVHLRMGGQRAQDYLALNPQGLVPALALDDGARADAVARDHRISRRDAPVAAAAAAPTPAARARVRAIALAIACDIHPLNNLRVLNYLIGTLGVAEGAEGRLVPLLDRRRLRGARDAAARDGATGRFCHGDAPTLADICLVPQIANARRVRHRPVAVSDADAHRGRLQRAARVRARRACAPARRRMKEPRHDRQYADSRVGPAVGARRRHEPSAFPSATSIASAATTPSTRRRWAATRRRSRRSSSPSPPMPIVPVVPPAVGRIALSAGDEELPPRDRARRRDRRRAASSVAPEHAQALIYGYAVGLDMTRRDLQNDMREKKRPWDIGKSFAQAAPIAPIHPATTTGTADARRDHARRQRPAAAAAAISPT